MARRTPARSGRAAAAAPRARGRAAKATSKKVSTPAPSGVEVVEEAGGGLNIDAGIAIITTVLLLAAILFVDRHLGHYGGGVFF